MLKVSLVFFLICCYFSDFSIGAVSDRYTQKNINYRTYFGNCPSRSSGMLSVLLMKEFEKNHSLKDVKKKILEEKLTEKYFLSSYRISYNPSLKTLGLYFECPEPLAKVQVYRSSGEEHYSAILASNAKIYEPHYENLLRTENKLNMQLPLLATSMKEIEETALKEFAGFIKLIDRNLRSKISEIIISKKRELTIIFGLNGQATSVFMGKELWEDKIKKLSRIVNYVGKSKKYPSSINLVNAKKVVVKFSDKI